MKKINVIAALLVVGHLAYAQTTWKIDQLHSRISFSVKHMVVSEVEGYFRQFEGKILSPSKDFDGAQVDFTAQTTSVDTGNENRDGHLRAEEFFDSEKFPTIVFKGNLFKMENKYRLSGTLTMKDVTKDVVFDVDYNGSIDTGKGIKAGFKFQAEINRQEYGLKWQKTLASGDFAVGDDVKIRCVIELDKI